MGFKAEAVALAETRKNFEAVSSLKMEILEVFEHGNRLAAELKIVIDGKEKLFVVDIISVNKSGQIDAIRAFVGRGDDGVTG